MRLRSILVFALVALFTVVGVAHAAKSTPVITTNVAITTAAQISASGGTACVKLQICNMATGAAARLSIKNSSGVTTSNGVTLWPNAPTATEESRCANFDPVQLPGTIKTVDATTFYAVSHSGTGAVQMLCIP